MSNKSYVLINGLRYNQTNLLLTETFFVPFLQQLGCFMGFSITACVITGVMFICYCVAVDEFARTIRCRETYGYNGYHRYYSNCYSRIGRLTARNGAGLGSCLLIFSLVEFFVALASSIYCCTGICCNTTAGAVGTVSIQYVLFVFVRSNLDIACTCKTCKWLYLAFLISHCGKVEIK